MQAQALTPAPSMPPSEPSEPAPAPSPPAQALPAPALSLVPIIANDWFSGSDEGKEDEVQAPALIPSAPLPLSSPAAPLSAPAPPSAPSPSLPAHASPAPALPLETAPALSSVPILADDWSSGTDEEGKGGLAEKWSSASGNESEAIPAADDVVKNRSLASQGSGSGSS